MNFAVIRFNSFYQKLARKLAEGQRAILLGDTLYRLSERVKGVDYHLAAHRVNLQIGYREMERFNEVAYNFLFEH
jgi:hypothetical protein